jgi:hypothetical protein
LLRRIDDLEKRLAAAEAAARKKARGSIIVKVEPEPKGK